ncbi:MAG: hypothetical protein NVSMB6_27220 [Burkholderiaceae bacterium]
MTAVAAIVKRDAKLALSYPLSFWAQWIGIFTSVVAFWFISQLVHASPKLGFGGRPGGYFDYVIVNVAFFSVQATALQSFAQSIRGDQVYGTLECMLVTPTKLTLIVLASSVWSFIITLLQVFWYLFLASALFGLHLGGANALSAAVFILLIVASSAPIGILSAATIMKFKQGVPTNLLVGGAASLLSGVLFPVALLPVPLQYASWCLPISHGLRGMRGAIHGAPLNQLSSDAIWLVVASLVLFPISLLTFKHAVTRAKVDGTLSDY